MADELQKSQSVFFSGVLLLTLSTVLVKAVGLLYKIPMLSYLGSEGMGYFNSAYEIYALFCIIATAGLPVALSVLISGAVERGARAQADKIYSVAFRVFLCIGLIGCGLMWIFAKSFCEWIRSEKAYACILSIAPTVFFVCISSAIRGYFQGFQRMFPTALSQVLESVGKLVFGLLFAALALQSGYGTEIVAAAAGWGLTLGTAVSTVYLVIEKNRFCKVQKDERAKERTLLVSYGGKGIARTLGGLALPMTLGASLGSLTKVIDMTMIIRGLQTIGYTEKTANEAYGAYTTLALSVFSLLPTLLNSVALPLVPSLSAAIAAKDCIRQKQMTEASFRLTAFFAIPASIGIAAFSKEILSLIFRNQNESIDFAAPLLSFLGISVFLSCMITATNSVLHAYQIVKLPILSLGIGVVVKIFVLYFLIENPSVGILGAPISSICCNLCVVFLNFIFAGEVISGISVKKLFLLPLLNASVSIGFSFFCYHYLKSKYSLGEGGFLCFFGIAVILYLALSVLAGTLRWKDICQFSCANRLFQRLKHIKARFFKENKQKTGK